MRGVEHARGNVLSFLVKLREGIGLDRAEVSVEADDRKTRICFGAIAFGILRQEIEDLYQLKLVIQVPLEPQHDFVEVSVPKDEFVALVEILLNLAELTKSLLSEPFGTRTTELPETLIWRDRTFVKDVAPADDLAFYSARFHSIGGGVAIGDVKSIRHLRQN